MTWMNEVVLAFQTANNAIDYGVVDGKPKAIHYIPFYCEDIEYVVVSEPVWASTRRVYMENNCRDMVLKKYQLVNVNFDHKDDPNESTYLRKTLVQSETPNIINLVGAKIENDIFVADEVIVMWIDRYHSDYNRQDGPSSIRLTGVSYDMGAGECTYDEAYVSINDQNTPYEYNEGEDILGLQFSKDYITRIRTLAIYGNANDATTRNEVVA